MKKRIAKKKGLTSVFSPLRNANALLYGPPPVARIAAKRLKDKIDSVNVEGKDKKDTEQGENK